MSIVGKGVSLRAGGQHEFSCVAFGSRPAAALTWWFDQTIVKDGMEGVHVVSELSNFPNPSIPKPAATKETAARVAYTLTITTISLAQQRETEHVKSVNICSWPRRR